MTVPFQAYATGARNNCSVDHIMIMAPPFHNSQIHEKKPCIFMAPKYLLILSLAASLAVDESEIR